MFSHLEVSNRSIARAHVCEHSHVCDVHVKLILKHACNVRTCNTFSSMRCAIALLHTFQKNTHLKKNQNVRVQVQVHLNFGQNAYLRAMCVRPKIDMCQKICRTSQFVKNSPVYGRKHLFFVKLKTCLTMTGRSGFTGSSKFVMGV